MRSGSSVGRIFSAALLLPLLASACVRISTTRLGEPASPELPVDAVRVFATNAPANYTEVAVLKSHRFFANDSKVLDALREQAAKLGANGVLLLNTRGSGSSQHSGSGVIIGGRADGGVIVGSGTSKVDDFERAVAIRYSDDLIYSSRPK